MFLIIMMMVLTIMLMFMMMRDGVDVIFDSDEEVYGNADCVDVDVVSFDTNDDYHDDIDDGNNDDGW